MEKEIPETTEQVLDSVEQVGQPDMPVKLVRNLAPLGEELYESKCDDHCANLNKAWRDVEDVLLGVSTCSTDISSLCKLGDDLYAAFDKYMLLSDDHIAFVSRTNTKDSCAEMVAQFTS